MELTRTFFERDLSADEADRLGELLQSDPQAAEALLAQAREHYRACGLPEPTWAGRPRRGVPRGLYWAGGLLMAAGLSAYFFSDEQTPSVPVSVWASGAPDREVALPAPKHAPPSPAAAVDKPREAQASRRGHQLQVLLRLEAAGPAQVTVVDGAGHVRRQLFQGYLAAGEHALPWNGLDDAGKPVPAGDYQVVVDDQGRRMVQTLRIKR